MTRRKVLIKYGGNAMINEKLQEQIAHQIKALQQHNFQVVLVHGGGPFIHQALEEAGIASEFFEGQRKTTKEALAVIERTLKGDVNSSLVHIFNRVGINSVGLSGKDGQTVRAEKKQLKSKDGSLIDLGQVGEITSVNPKLLRLLLEGGFLPIITCLGSDAAGNDYNINGDVFAGKIASALEVDDYIVLTDVDGLYKDYPDPASIITRLSLSQLPSLYHTVITGGMIPKIQSCEAAVASGVKRAVILNGTKPEQLSESLLKNKPLGTSLNR